MNSFNQEILTIASSTGMLAISDKYFYLFYDRETGFLANRETSQIFFYNNLLHSLLEEEEVEIIQFYYIYPLVISEQSLSVFFRAFLQTLDDTSIENHQYSAFLWEIGTITLNETRHYNSTLYEMRKIHGSDFNPEY